MSYVGSRHAEIAALIALLMSQPATPRPRGGLTDQPKAAA